MENNQISVYLREIRTQAAYVRYAAIALHEILMSEEIKHDILFFHVSNILNYSANIAKIITGSPERLSVDKKFRAERITQMKEITGVSNDSILLNKNIRNSFEHMDDRIDDWCVSDNQGNLVGSFIGPRSAIYIENKHRTNIMRQYEPNNTVWFFDDSLNIQDLVNEVMRIDSVVEQMIGQ